MKALSVPVLLLALAGSGCMTQSLHRHAVGQSQSTVDARYQSALRCLAMVAADPGTLPSFTLLSSGTVSITNTGILNPVSTWSGAPFLFTSEALAVTGSHAPQQLWTVSPVADHTQLQAMRSACRWVLEGQDPNTLGGIAILADPEDPANAEEDSKPGPHPHFGVAGRLAALPHGWLHCGRESDIPQAARYKERWGHAWVWVTPDGLAGLAEFTLALLDIATLNVAPSDGSPPANVTPPVLVTLWSIVPTLPPSQKSTVTITVKRVGDTVIYPEKTEVMVGQSVVWQNGDSDGTSPHSAASTIPGLFDTTAIPPKASSQPVLFDDAKFIAAGGYSRPDPNKPLEIEYSDKVGGGAKAKIALTRNPFTSLYSQTLIFHEDRVIKPCFLPIIEARMGKILGTNPTGLEPAPRAKVQPRTSAGLDPNAQDPKGAVEISYEEWMEWTLPYQGQRTAVKPGSSQSTPVIMTARTVPATDTLQRLQALPPTPPTPAGPPAPKLSSDKPQLPPATPPKKPVVEPPSLPKQPGQPQNGPKDPPPSPKAQAGTDN